MKQKSMANLEVYKNKTKEYDEFSKAEDFPKKIDRFMFSKIKNKIVLDVGCGSGKYAKIFGPSTKKYFALDISKEQLKMAKKNVGNSKKVKFIHSSAEKIPLPDESIDIVFSSWAISVMKKRKIQKKALQEIERVLTKKGVAFIIENNSTGEYEIIRKHPKQTQARNKWMEKQGYKPKQIKTYFKFKNLEDAKDVIRSFYGKSIANKLKSGKIEHHIIIFSK
jgi:ubiquinone/menaquinone biosynthesis C-methylase UbiE